MAATRSVLPLVCAALLGATAGAQDPDPPSPPDPPATDPARESVQGPAVVVTATRIAEDPFEIPYSVESITDRDIRRRSYRTTPQALRDVPGVMVQETAHGHGSPYIRGFTSFRTLFLIDGVRLNNSTFRSGPNQYWNTVDPLSLDRLELVKGPSSVLYGSDAIGGTVNAFTRRPETFGPEGETTFAGRSYVRYASAEDSMQGRGELSFGYTWAGGARTGVLAGGSAKSFDDLEGGDGVGTQPETGYDETALDVTVEHWFDDDTRVVFLHQRVSQNDVPRTHRTVNGLTWRGLSPGSDQVRQFDQDRNLTYLQLHRTSIDGPIDAVHFNLSWHEQEETRERIRGSGAQEFQGFDADTFGVWLQLESSTPIGHLTYGVEYYRDEVDSFFGRAVPQPGDEIQGPIADDASYDLLGVYLQDQIDVTDQLQFTLGGRFNWAGANADSVRDPATGNRISITDDWSAFVGSARILYRLVPDAVNLFGGVSQGFRAPNLSDLSRFDSARSNEFEVPAPSLDPEDYISYEVGAKVETEDLSLQSSYFYTDIKDQILRFPTGNTNAAGESEVTKANVGDGHIYGVEAGLAYRVIPSTTVFGNATYLHGRISNFDGTSPTLQETFPTRLMPFTMQVGVRWEEEQDRFWAETVLIHAEEADKLSFSDQRDTSRIPSGGTPGYTLWHVRAGCRIHDSAELTVLLENITDADYRVHGSGLNRPGRNLVLGLSVDF